MPATTTSPKPRSRHRPRPRRHPLLASLTRLLSRAYLLDWLCVILLKVASYFLRFLTPPVHQQFLVSDLRISHPLAESERVTSVQNYLYSAALPTGLIILWGLTWRPGFHQAHVTVLGLLVSITLAGFLTGVVKNAIGRPRPDLLARCIARLDTPPDRLVGIEVCTNEDADLLNDGWRSFPSGHASLAFSGLGYFAFFLSGQLRIFQPKQQRPPFRLRRRTSRTATTTTTTTTTTHSRSHSQPDLARVLAAFAPLVGAMLVAMSRLADYRHDPYDVTVGSLIGIGFAFWSYRRYYKPLRSVRCHEVWPSPAGGGDSDDSRSRSRSRSRNKLRRMQDLEQQQHSFADDDDDDDDDDDEYQDQDRGHGQDHVEAALDADLEVLIDNDDNNHERGDARLLRAEGGGHDR